MAAETGEEALCQDFCIPPEGVKNKAEKTRRNVRLTGTGSCPYLLRLSV